MKAERLEVIKNIHAKMRKECKTWGTEDIYGDQLLAFDDLIKESEQLAELKQRLKEIEWYDNETYTDKVCVVCGNLKRDGHEESCWLKRAIGE